MKRYGMPAQLKNGLVLHLPGVVSGTTAYDASGAGNNGTLVNSPTRMRRQGYAGFDYNGSTQSCMFPNINSLRSFSCTVRYDTNNRTILIISAGNSISISSSNTITVTGLTNATVYVNGTTVNSLSSGKWHRITVNFDSVNSSSGSIANSSFDGMLFDPILRTNALTATEAMLDARTFFIP